MFKMIFTLAAAIYAGFVIWGAPVEDTAQAAPEEAPVILAATTGTDFAQPTILGAAAAPAPEVTRAAVTTTVVPDPATIAASAPTPTTLQPRLIGEPVVVSLVQPAAPAPAEATSTADDRDLLRVTGSRVNMRSGPSTGNRIVDSLSRGTLAEAIGPETNGWLEIRDINSGLTGFMAARFLEPN